MTTETKIEIRYSECDQTGMVRHTVYPIWYEIARMDFFSRLGVPFSDPKQRVVNPPLVNLTANYFFPIAFPGTVTVRTRIASISPKNVELHYDVLAPGSDQPLASATTYHVWTGPDRLALDMQKCLPEAYAKLEAAQDET